MKEKRKMQIEILKTKKDKEEFLENDLIDRIIKIEQKISAKFGKFINYEDTFFYKNLTPKNRERYKKYLNKKRRKKLVFGSIFLLPLFGLFFLSNNITGNVIAEKTGDSFFSFIQIFLLGFLFGFFGFILLKYLLNLRRRKRFEPLFNPLEKIKKKSF